MQRADQDQPAKDGTLREAAVRVVRILREAGHVAYLAGGCVRDQLLGIEPKDYDVATDARPNRVMQLFRGSRAVGEAFGVVLVRRLGQTIEVATFRKDWGYEDGRRPTRIDFTDAEHDAQRRDFTINGLFEDPLAQGDDQRIIDYVNGVTDLKAGVVRTIGSPDERFAEDYLRLLRAVRFAARLGFQIDPATSDAIKPLHDRLDQISRERIGHELQMMLVSNTQQTAPNAGPTRAVQLLQALHLDGPVLEEDHAEPELVTIRALFAVPVAHSRPDPPTALAAWMLDRHLFDSDHAADVDLSTLGKAVTNFIEQRLLQLVNQWRRALSLSNDLRDALKQTSKLLPRALAWPTLSVAQKKRLLADTRWPQARLLLEALSGLCHEIPEHISKLDREAVPMIDQGVDPEPWVTGDDLIAMGFIPGPAFRRLIDAAYDAQLEREVTDREEALVWVKQLAGGSASQG